MMPKASLSPSPLGLKALGIYGMTKTVTLSVNALVEDYFGIRGMMDAEALRRLVALGARIAARVRTWIVMEAPTGQRFCVVRAKRPLEGLPGVTTWP